MITGTNEENLRKAIEEYINQKGITGFFGLLASISPRDMDAEDLRKHQEDLSIRTVKVQPKDEEDTSSITIESQTQEASIYAPEHIPAVQDDKREHEIVTNNEVQVPESPKTRVLEVPKSSTKRIWEDAEVVVPGQLKL